MSGGIMTINNKTTNKNLGIYSYYTFFQNKSRQQKQHKTSQKKLKISKISLAIL